MAEQTGITEIDALIERFQGELIARFDPSRPVADLKGNPALAESLCNIVATQFAEFCRAHDVEAESLSEEGYFGPADELGYHDRPVEGSHDQHDLTFVDWDGYEFTVDFTAAQYGYREFPLVQRRAAGADDAWERAW